MKLLMENWRKFVNEEDKKSKEEEEYISYETTFLHLSPPQPFLVSMQFM